MNKAEGGAKNYKRDHPYRYPGDPLPSFSAAKGIGVSVTHRQALGTFVITNKIAYC